MVEDEEISVALTAPTAAAMPGRPAPRRRAAPVSVSGLELGVAPGDRIGRYVLRELIGAGGMGVVFTADDPDLDRRVALKLIRPGTGADDEVRARLIREGQAIARLAHPNIVTVHDIGVAGDDLCFVAMEYVAGCSLRDWLAARRRTPREIVGVFAQAGQGLAAAHAKGIFHRDFKPDNVLVGDDGRVRVADFGIARAADAPDAVDGSEDTGGDDRATPSLHTPLTRPGRVMGTPAYMAPEQHRGRRGDARSDQFAFCVALYHALSGAHPYPALARGLERGDRLAPPPAMPAGARVPRWLDRLVRRGLALDPAARFASMDALLAELRRDRGRTARVALIGGAIAGSVALGVALAAPPADEARACQGAGAMLRAAWDDGARQRVRAAFLATGRAHAADTFARVDRALDAYGAAWTAMSTAACEATRVHGVQSERVLDLRTACLDRRLAELRALVGVLSGELDARQLDHAVQAASGLTPVDACAAEAVRAAGEPAPADPRVDELRARLDQATALQSTGAYADALAIAADVAAAADAAASTTLQAEAWLRVGALQHKHGDPGAAEASLERALRAASAARDSALVARVLSELVWVVGYLQARYDEGLAYFESAAAAAELAGGDAILRAQLLKHAGGVRFDQGAYDDARRHYEAGAAAVIQVFGDDHPHAATALNNVGTALLAAGDADAALPYFERALAIGERTLGADHPYVADYRLNLGAVLGDLGRYAASRAHYQRALAALERTLGADHPDLAYPLFNLGVGYTNEGACAEAIPHYERALALREAALGADHPHVAYPLTGIGNCQLALGRPADAIAVLERAARILEASETDPNPLARARFDLARALWDAGTDRARAVELAAAARRTWVDAPRWAEELASVSAWLDERQPDRR